MSSISTETRQRIKTFLFLLFCGFFFLSVENWLYVVAGGCLYGLTYPLFLLWKDGCKEKIVQALRDGDIRSRTDIVYDPCRDRYRFSYAEFSTGIGALKEKGRIEEHIGKDGTLYYRLTDDDAAGRVS